VNWNTLLRLADELLTTGKRFLAWRGETDNMGLTGGSLLLELHERWQAFTAAVADLGLLCPTLTVDGSNHALAAVRALRDMAEMQPSDPADRFDRDFFDRLAVTVDLLREAAAKPTGANAPPAAGRATWCGRSTANVEGNRCDQPQPGGGARQDDGSTGCRGWYAAAGARQFGREGDCGRPQQVIFPEGG
jgi:hypothetical protein